ncbi:MAG: hypothetical protein Q7S21_05095 [archaeon]|nr:hypothetical protein [archaeon]
MVQNMVLMQKIDDFRTMENKPFLFFTLQKVSKSHVSESCHETAFLIHSEGI